MIDRRALTQLALLLPLAGCSRWEEEVVIQGAGATLPYPLYSKWIDEYHRQNPSVFINYQSIGSGGGVRQITAGTVDFAASDIPMNRDEVQGAPSELLHLPMAIGAVAVGYHEALPAGLHFTPELLAEIFLGKVTRWNDPALAAENPTAQLGDLPINVVYRTDGSGTSAVYTAFLADSSRTWRELVGSGKNVRWPVGLGAKGSEGAARQVQGTPGAIGYVELAYTAHGGLRCGLVRNRAGHFVAPSSDSVATAARSVSMPSELHVPLLHAGADDAYPLATYTYLLVFRDAPDRRKAEALARFVWWAVHEGQSHAAALGYAPLPAAVVLQVEEALHNLRSEGQVLLPAGALSRR